MMNGVFNEKRIDIMVVKLTQGPPRIFRDACTLSISVSFFQLLILYPLGGNVPFAIRIVGGKE